MSGTGCLSGNCDQLAVGTNRAVRMNDLEFIIECIPLTLENLIVYIGVGVFASIIVFGSNSVNLFKAGFVETAQDFVFLDVIFTFYRPFQFNLIQTGIGLEIINNRPGINASGDDKKYK